MWLSNSSVGRKVVMSVTGNAGGRAGRQAFE